MNHFALFIILPLAFLSSFASITNYNDTLAHIQWDFAIISYCKQQLIQSWTCGSEICGLHQVSDVQIVYLEKDNILGYVLYSQEMNSIQVVLRGTMPLSIKDWIGDDADLILEAYPYCVGCEVETGFWNSFQTMEAEMIQAVKNTMVKYPNADINVVGHSLGASYAALISASLYLSNITIKTIYTFGQPRVGNQALADWFDQIFPNNYARIVHHRDIIPHLPFEDLGYVHMNTEVFYDYDSTSYQICTETEEQSCSDQYPIELCDIIPGHSYYMGKSIMPFFDSCSNGINSRSQLGFLQKN